MVEYSEVTAIRRTGRLIRDAGRPNFSILTALVFIVLILVVIMGVMSMVE